MYSYILFGFVVTAHKVVTGLVPVNLSLSMTGNGGISLS
jgi:hypothetical protein